MKEKGQIKSAPHPTQRFDVVHVVLRLQGIFALVERDETATCRNQKGEKTTKIDSNLILPLLNAIALGLDHKIKTRRKQEEK